MEEKRQIQYANFNARYANDAEFRRRHIARVRASKLKKLGLNPNKIKFINKEVTVVFC
jgi:hypothetical protein